MEEIPAQWPLIARAINMKSAPARCQFTGRVVCWTLDAALSVIVH
jgi:hypothetical protein